MKRYNPHFSKGLTSEEVNCRVNENLINYDTDIKTKSIFQIILMHTFTLFNLINFLLGFMVFLTHSYKNMLFLGIVFTNLFIGIIQEIRSKKIIDKLSVIASNKTKVIRNDNLKEININEIVLDDIIVFESGNQIVTDSYVVSGEVEVNEAFITGESLPVVKKTNDLLLSGSFIISGKCYGKVEHIGTDNYTSQISKDAKCIKKINSELLKSLKKVIKISSIVIIPLGLLLFYKQTLINSDVNSCVINTVAAMISMIPEGLVLLISTVLALSIIKLSKFNVLVQELYAIESLARVNMLCLDKTGTLTTGELELYATLPINNYTIKEVTEIMCNISYYSVDNNKTIEAIRSKYKKESTFTLNSLVPFSSERKYASYIFNNRTYVIGAPDVLLKDDTIIKEYIDKYAREYRMLVVAKTNDFKENKNDVQLIAILLLRDQVKEEAAHIIEYLKKEEIKIKIISGDNIITISDIAKRLGMKNLKAIDYNDITDLTSALDTYDIIGRVTPSGKKDIICKLKEKYTVGMTGDGVNDVLALNEADCSIAMASGSDAAKNVSKLVLLDSKFDALPEILLEGRRVINNVERSSSLFLVKTIYATLLAIIFLFVNLKYPFEPIQLSLIGAVTIGIPAFFLALEPNKNKIKGNFFTNVFSRALPGGLTIVINIILIVIINSLFKFSYEQISTLSVITTTYIGFMYLFKICLPFNKRRIILFVSLLIFYLLQVIFLPKLYSLITFNLPLILFCLILILLSSLIFNIFTKMFMKTIKKR